MGIDRHKAQTGEHLSPWHGKDKMLKYGDEHPSATHRNHLLKFEYLICAASRIPTHKHANEHFDSVGVVAAPIELISGGA